MHVPRTCHPRPARNHTRHVKDPKPPLTSQQVEEILEEVRQLRASIAVYRSLVDKLSGAK